MSVLVDTNVLLRRTQPDHSSHTIAVESVAKLLRSGEPVRFTLQNISEFWNVVTRPIANNVLGYPVADAAARSRWQDRTGLNAAARMFQPSIASGSDWWWQHVLVQGSKVHDTRLVAAMNIHGVRRILTFNGSDFFRYQIEVLDPSAVLV